MSRPICPGPLSRREFLHVGALGTGGLLLPELFAARAAADQLSFDTSVILLYLHGGPSQLETYDLKPNAPLEYRSIFSPIPTTVPGMEICELFPEQAKLADKFSLVRSLHHTMSSHSDGGIEVLTGKTPVMPDPTSQSKSSHPDVGSVVSRLRGEARVDVPHYVAIPNQMYMTRPAYLGVQHGALNAGDPAVENYRSPIAKLATGVDAQGLENRRQLLRQLDQARRGIDLAGLDLQDAARGTDRFREMAFHLLSSSRVASAFDLAQETEATRDRYGRHIWGQACLLARRLAEAGVGVVTVYYNTPRSGDDFTNWDDHIMNAGRPGHFGHYMRVRLPYMDQSLSALIGDIHDRGRDRQILVVVMGEFGRTPRLSHNSNGVGRDHWPQAYSVLFSGGGLRMGQVVGATNSKAEYPTERPYTPQDVLATIYRHLGITATESLADHAGRPIPILPHGKPIPELI